MSKAKVKLGGKEFTIPVLVIKQLRELDWRIMRASPALLDRSKLNQETRDDLFDIVYIALTQENPALTREEFDAMGITLPEVMNAVPVIAMQTGMFKPAVEAPPQTGEEPTGTES
jgi:hypothetical protein